MWENYYYNMSEQQEKPFKEEEMEEKIKKIKKVISEKEYDYLLQHFIFKAESLELNNITKQTYNQRVRRLINKTKRRLLEHE